MQYVKAQAPAKVNLALRVGSARSDGFHPLDTVFEALNLYETLEAWNDPSGRLSLEFSSQGFGAGLPVDESNLAIRAGLLLKERYGAIYETNARDDGAAGSAGSGGSAGTPRRTCGARMKILKRIPIAGGMAGGSADAAAALVALNELWELGLSRDELMVLGAELGSDVPFALMGGIAHGQGRGEKLVPIVDGAKNASSSESYSHGFVMLINPQGLSTPAVFHEFDRLCSEHKLSERNSEAVEDISAQQGAFTSPTSTIELRRALEDNLETGRLDSMAAHMVNDLEAPAFSLRPDLAALVHELRSEKIAEAVILSGSGPTIAVLCEPHAAPELAQRLGGQFPQLLAVATCAPASGAHVVNADSARCIATSSNLEL